MRVSTRTPPSLLPLPRPANMHGGAKGRPQNEFTRVKFRVKAPLGHGETVGVVGDSRSLGNFNPNGAITLVTSPETYPMCATLR